MPRVSQITASSLALALCSLSVILPANAMTRFSTFKAHPPIHTDGKVSLLPGGKTPEQIKSAYQLPTSGGQGTIALIEAFHSQVIEHDLSVFTQAFHLPACNKSNGCLEQHVMNTQTKTNPNWNLETALDAEWAHAIAPQAKILVVEAASGSGKDLLAAIDYAKQRPDVIAVSMSWGGPEFGDEHLYDSHFIAPSTSFFASSGDHGTGVNWPAVSPNVISVGGTTLVSTSSSHASVQETAWGGSGGGVSAYEAQPLYQTTYNLKRANGKRAVPDVSYNADPISGFSVFHASSKTSKLGWRVLGGTSAGAPQWAAIHALGHSVTHTNIYSDKAKSTNTQFFRDITSGTNGDCPYYCEARKHYDYVTGLGSPLTAAF